jgi:hypothetical protein
VWQKVRIRYIETVYYENDKVRVKKRLIFECRCDERIKLKVRDLHVSHTLKICFVFMFEDSKSINRELY